MRAPVQRMAGGHATPAGAGRLESASALFRLLSDSALSRAALSACGLPIALAEASPEHALTYANTAFEAFFGYRPGEAQGAPLETLVALSQEAARRLSGDAPARVPATARRKDGTTVNVEVAIGPLHGADGHLTHWVLAFSDRSELQALREELGMLRARGAAS